MFQTIKRLLALATLTAVVACGSDEGTKNVVATVDGDSRSSVLTEAIVAADLASTFSATDNITVFAPTNDAFAALLTGLGVTKADVPAGSAITTLQRQTFTVDSTLAITDRRARRSNITTTDVLASNGVVHVIDKVILPAP